MSGALELLAVHRQTGFTFDERDRMLYESAPDRSPGRRFSFTGCTQGNLAVVRADVPDHVAEELERLIESEPPLSEVDQDPVRLDAYARLLGGEGKRGVHLHGLLWVFPEPLEYKSGANLIWSGSADGDALLDRFVEVIPQDLAEKGFRAVDDLWEPWCVATVDGRIASIAETVRAGARGAEVGVDTSTEFRGLGLGAAATAGWSQHDVVAGRELFYSTARSNRSSRRLTERLDLTFIGSSYGLE
jgi:hypothetical protein